MCDDDYHHVDALFEEAADMSRRGATVFCQGNKAIFKDFVDQFQTLNNVVDPLKIALDVVIKCCPVFDLDASCKGNGYRSIVSVTCSCIDHILKLTHHVLKAKERFFFRSYHLFMELKSAVQVLCRMLTVVQFAVVLLHACENGCLFADDHHYSGKMLDDLMSDFERLNRECFYGRCFGFQYSASFKPTLNIIGVAMAAYGDGYDRHDGGMARAISSVIHSGKYMIDPELRAKRIVQLTNNTSMGFCKAFWSITESHGIQHVPLLLCPTVSINREIRIPTTPITMESSSGEVTITLPQPPVCSEQIFGRLLSYAWRDGQWADPFIASSPMNGMRAPPLAKSKYLIFHCHGGGFVAQSSKSHEFYLRYWAKELNVPILSIDYSLSPEAPFPQALDECFFAYAWALKNAHLLGTTAEVVCVAGDSAGGNLVVALALKTIQRGIRPPDCIAAAYPALLVEYVPSPSRLLSIMDPLLPLGVLKACLFAYALPKKEDTASDSKDKKPYKTVCTGQNYNAYDLNLGGVDSHVADDAHVTAIFHRAFSDSNIPSSMISRYVNFKGDLIGAGDFFHPLPHRCRFGRHSSEQWDTLSLSSAFSDLDCGDAPASSDNIEGSSAHKHVSAVSPLADGDVTTSTVTEGTSTNAEDCGDVHHDETNDGFSPPPSPMVSQHKTWLRRVSSSLRHRRSLSAGVIVSSNENKRRHSFYFDDDDDDAGHGPGHQHDDDVTPGNDVLDGGVEPVVPPTGELLLRGNTETDTHLNGVDRKEIHAGSTDIHHDKFGAVLAGDAVGDTESYTTCKSGSIPAVTSPSDSTDSPSFYHYSPITTPRNPFLSPLEAPDSLLKSLPPINIVACALDPLLDDSVEFCKRVRAAGGTAELYVIDKLPHGFLQLSIVSEEAKEGCDLVLACMKQLLGIGMKSTATQTNNTPESQ